jgi:hypothetical protein
LSVKQRDWPKPYETCNDKHKVCKIKSLNLEDNYMTQEGLRIIWLLLDTKEELTIKISKPQKFNWNFTPDMNSYEDTGPVDLANVVLPDAIQKMRT